MTTFADQVCALVARVPHGRVVSYGGIAAMLGRPRAARAVGQALRNLSDDRDVPWWRVLDANGRISVRGASDVEALQRRLLESEGVRFRSDRADWNHFGWSGPGAGVVKRSIAIAIHHSGTGRIVVVQRPDDDEDLPGVWGLPAGSLLPGESWIGAVVRAGTDKLGVHLDVRGMMAHGSSERESYTIEMRLYNAAIISGGEPAVPQADESVTQYQSWRWGNADDVRPAAARGSLCSSLYLQSVTAARTLHE